MEAKGPIAVFDPQQLAPGIPSAPVVPIRGCEDPHIAMIRAKALTAGTVGTTDSNFWQSSAEQRSAACSTPPRSAAHPDRPLPLVAVGGPRPRGGHDLSTHADAAPSWHQALEVDRHGRPAAARLGVGHGHHRVLSLGRPQGPRRGLPGSSEHFDPERFLRDKGTVYLLGTSTGSAATAGLVGAFVEDVVEGPPDRGPLPQRTTRPTARPPRRGGELPAALPAVADVRRWGHWDLHHRRPPVALAGRAVWGEHAASAIWDAAIVKVILGGGSNARDLEDLSKLIGQRTEEQTSTSVGWDGRRTTSTSTHQVPIIEPGRLRTLPFGTAIPLLRSARPIVLTLRSWTTRKDAKLLQGHRRQLEEAILGAHADQS